MQTLLQDLRYAARMLWRQPVFSLVALLTLALGIGANTAIFSLIDAVFLRSLPFPESDRLVSVWDPPPDAGKNEDNDLSLPKYEFVRDQQTVFEEQGASVADSFTLTGRGDPVQITGAFASGRFFQALGVQPLRGRFFLPEEDLPGGAKVVVVTDGFWRKYAGGDPALVGQTLTLNGDVYTVVGIAPSQTIFPFSGSELFLPGVFNIPDYPPAVIQQGGVYLNLTARLKPGVTLGRANEELSLLSARYRQAFPKHIDTESVLRARPLQEEIIGDSRPMFYTLTGAVGSVLLIACVNVANLLLARQAGRRREIAIRAALGAGWWRLARQFVTESLLLTLLAGAMGTVLALWCVDLAHGIGPEVIPRAGEVRLNGPALLFTLGISLAVGLVLGVVPALHAGSGEPGHTLQQANSRGSGGVQQGRTRAALLVAQVAISLVLLVGTGLLLTSLWQLQRVRLGYNPDALLTVDLTLPAARYPEVGQRADFYARLMERLDAAPGVRRAGASTGGPMGNYLSMFYLPAGQPAPPIEQRPNCRYAVVTPDYFATIETPLRQGRTFTALDREGSPPVMLVNETWARKVFPDGNVLGQKILCTNANPTLTEIVGVVADAHTGNLAKPPRPEMYFPTYQRGELFMSVYVRAGTPAQALGLGPEVRAAVHAVDPDQSVGEVQGMQSVINRSMADRRLMAGLLAGFAGLALVLAAIGIYGVTAYSVAQRTREIGIRMALGAGKGDVFRLIVVGGMRLILVGVVIGVVSALGLTRLLASLLYGVGSGDPLTFAAVIGLLMVVALLANYLPARRATRVNPLAALREE